MNVEEMTRQQRLEAIQEYHPGCAPGKFSYLVIATKEGEYQWNTERLEKASDQVLFKVLVHMKINKADAMVNFRKFQQAREKFFEANPDTAQFKRTIKGPIGEDMDVDGYEAHLATFRRNKYNERMRDRVLYGEEVKA